MSVAVYIFAAIGFAVSVIILLSCFAILCSFYDDAMEERRREREYLNYYRSMIEQKENEDAN